jgi:regulation of enolase protein 1 (concanavalin A-like superfamily)
MEIVADSSTPQQQKSHLMVGKLIDLTSQPVLSWADDRLVWLYPDSRGTDGATVENSADALTIRPLSKTDMWMRTYYSPTLIKCNAPMLGARLPTTGWATAETKFDISPAHQFDQGGLCAYIDDENWLKAGIEVVDGQPRVSVVVTNRGFSDWSTRSYPDLELSMRLHQRDHSFVVEVQHGKEEDEAAAEGQKEKETGTEKESGGCWEFIRIAHLSPPPPSPRKHVESADAADATAATASEHSIVMGVYACCPEQSSCAVRFSSLSIKSGSEFEHTN